MTRYDTFVVRNSTDPNIPRELAGGEVTAWAEGHRLDTLDACRAFIESIACGEFDNPSSAASNFLEGLKCREAYRGANDE